MENQEFAGGRVAGRRIARRPWGRIPRIATIVKINIYPLYIIERTGVGRQGKRLNEILRSFHGKLKPAP